MPLRLIIIVVEKLDYLSISTAESPSCFKCLLIFSLFGRYFFARRHVCNIRMFLKVCCDQQIREVINLALEVKTIQTSNLSINKL